MISTPPGETAPLKGTSAPLTAGRAFGFSPDGRLLATGGQENTITLWDAATRRKVRTLPGDATSAKGIAFSRDGKVLACGGLLSVLRAQKEIFFFDVSNPKAPRFISAADPPQSAITDEFYPLADGGFLVTMMGGAAGHAPGRVAEFTKDLQLVSEYPSDPPMDGFNPHGISVRPEMNLMVTSDLFVPRRHCTPCRAASRCGAV